MNLTLPNNHTSLPMEKTLSAVLIFGAVAFSCCVAAEFTKSKAARDVKLDGRLCSLRRSSAFGLGITAIICLFAAEIAGTSGAGARVWSAKSGNNRTASIGLLILSWLSFGLAAIMLGTASSMNNGQAYGRGWLDGECYVVKDGVYIGSAILAVFTVIFILGFTLTAARANISLAGGGAGVKETGVKETWKSHFIEFRSKDSPAGRRG